METNNPICPHCGQAISKFSLTIHVRSCVVNPEMQALLRQWLPDPNYPGFIRMMNDYERNTPARPSREHVVSYYGSWQKMAETFGLQLMNFNERRLAGKIRETGNEIWRLSQELHDGRYAPTQNEYHVYANQSDRVNGCLQIGNLIQRFGSWRAVLAHFNMTLPFQPPKRSEFDDEPWLKHRAARVEHPVVLPSWSLKYGFGRSD